MALKIGAHLSISGGYTKALEKIVSIGGNCLQIFSASPRGWTQVTSTPEDIEIFKKIKADLKVNPVYFHASYLINLASDEQTGKYSKQCLIAEMNLAAKLGIKGSIIHLGSFKENEKEVSSDVQARKYDVLINNIKEVLAQTPAETLFIIENSATRKIGQTVDEIAKIIKDIDDKRLKVCFDTCHLHAGGYNITSQESLDKFLGIFDSFVGMDRLELWHLNDSKDPAGSRRDRHENIGQGAVGLEVFKVLLNHPIAQKTPFIIETPGFDEKGPDKQNLDILKQLLPA